MRRKPKRSKKKTRLVKLKKAWGEYEVPRHHCLCVTYRIQGKLRTALLYGKREFDKFKRKRARGVQFIDVSVVPAYIEA